MDVTQVSRSRMRFTVSRSTASSPSSPTQTGTARVKRAFSRRNSLVSTKASLLKPFISFLPQVSIVRPVSAT